MVNNSLIRSLAWLWLLLGGLPGLLLAQSTTTTVESAPILEVYVRAGCPHCAAAKNYLPELAARHPGLQIVYRPVDTDPAARQALARISEQAGIWPPGVPTFVYQGRVQVGFGSASESGPILERWLAQAPMPSGMAAIGTVIENTVFGRLSASELGLPLFTLAVGLLDGFNPCAMWVLLFLLSLLVHLKDRRRMALIAGTFVFISGAVYYAFMAAWLNVFLVLGMSAALQMGLGVLALLIAALNIKDFAAFGRGPSLSIPASAKPGIYARMRRVVNARNLPTALLAVAVLALVVNFIELLCTAGFPAVYTAVLTQQGLSGLEYYAYLLLYIVAYMADDSLMVATAVLALSNRKLSEQGGRWLKLVSGLVMLGLGLVMIFHPEWLR